MRYNKKQIDGQLKSRPGYWEGSVNDNSSTKHDCEREELLRAKQKFIPVNSVDRGYDESE